MAHTDLSLAECLAYHSDLPAPPDLGTFWKQTFTEAEAAADEPRLTPVDIGLSQVRTHDITVAGFGGQPVHGWFHVPAGAQGRLPCVVEFLGYGRGRGLPHENLMWACAGYAHLIMDTRGQGWSSAPGATPDAGPAGAGAVPGLTTRGIESPETYYYRRLYVDAVRTVHAARSLPVVDPGRVVVTGGSQALLRGPGGASHPSRPGEGRSRLTGGQGVAGSSTPFFYGYGQGNDRAGRGPHHKAGAGRPRTAR